MTNPHQVPAADLVSLFRDLRAHWRLIVQLTQREISGRYRGSVLGLAWSFVNPLFLLSVYTFFFSVVLGARWDVNVTDSKGEFAIVLFSGMLVHGLVAECLIRAPGVVLANATYVKKVVFPLQILPWTVMGTAVIHAGISILVLLVAQLVLMHTLPWTVLLFPVLLVPLILGGMGMTWVLASVGVFIRDIGQLTGMVSTVLLFLSPVFYPITRVPEGYRAWLMLNPLTYFIEETRNVLLYGKPLDPVAWLIASAIGLMVAWLGYWWFQRSRRAFADVL